MNDAVQLPDVDLEDLGLPLDVAWVYTNFHKIQGVLKKDWIVRASDSPSPGAWSMLIWASENPDKFFDKVVTSQIKRTDKAEQDKESTEIEDIETIEKMLRNL